MMYVIQLVSGLEGVEEGYNSQWHTVNAHEFSVVPEFCINGTSYNDYCQDVRDSIGLGTWRD